MENMFFNSMMKFLGGQDKAMQLLFKNIGLLEPPIVEALEKIKTQGLPEGYEDVGVLMKVEFTKDGEPMLLVFLVATKKNSQNLVLVNIDNPKRFTKFMYDLLQASQQKTKSLPNPKNA